MEPENAAAEKFQQQHTHVPAKDAVPEVAAKQQHQQHQQHAQGSAATSQPQYFDQDGVLELHAEFAKSDPTLLDLATQFVRQLANIWDCETNSITPCQLERFLIEGFTAFNAAKHVES